MTTTSFATTPGAEPASPEYQPGVCNIGPAEIERRRMVGHVGLVATIGVVGALVLINAHPVTRLVAILPAAVSASGYLQARLKFCAGFAARGVFNFGGLGDSEQVLDDEARARDQRRARQIGLSAFAIGLVVGVVAVLLPV